MNADLIVDNPDKLRHHSLLYRQEAIYRAKLLKDVQYQLTFKFNDVDSQLYDGVVNIQFHHNSNGDIFIDFAGKSITTLVINGNELNSQQITNIWYENRIHLIGLQQGNHSINVAFTSQLTVTGFGLFKYCQDNEVYIYSLFCPNYANTCFPCFDQPDLKAVFQLSVQCPNQWKVISNRNPLQIESMSENELNNWIFQPTDPISTYLFVMVLGDWVSVCPDPTLNYNQLQTNMYCMKSCLNRLQKQQQLIVSSINFGMAYYENVFQIPYRFHKYDQIFCPDFQNGGMENPGAVLLTSQYLSSELSVSRRTNMISTILHEISHMWFGNLVTMEWWNDIWLNEAFAVYISNQCMVEFIHGQETEYENLNVRFLEYKIKGMLSDIKYHAHPIEIAIDEASQSQDAFDNITYSKGASVLTELVNQITPMQFNDAIVEYLKTYQWKNANMLQLFTIIAIRQNIPINTERWMNEWIQVPSLNVFQVDTALDDRIIITQSMLDSNQNTIRQHYISLMIFYEDEQSIITYKTTKVRISDKSIELNIDVGYVAVLLNYDDQSYCFYDFDLKSLNFITYHFYYLPIDEIIKVQIVNILYHMCLIGKLVIQYYFQFCIEIIKNTISYSHNLIKFVIQTLVDLHELMADTSEQTLYYDIYKHLEQQLYNMSNILNPTVDQSQTIMIIMHTIGKFVSTPNQIYMIYQWINQQHPKLTNIPFDMTLVKCFLDILFHQSHTIEPDNLIKYNEYWNTFKPYNRHLAMIQNGAQTDPVEYTSFFKELLDNHTSLSMQDIQMLLIGINNPHSPHKDKYLMIYFEFLPDVLQTQHRQFITNYITHGYPNHGELAKQLSILSDIVAQDKYHEFSSLILDKVDTIRLKININVSAPK